MHFAGGNTPITRRRFALGSAGLAMGLSGCSGGRGKIDLFISNRSGSSVTATVRIRRSGDGATILEERTSIDDQANKTYRDTVPEDEPVDVSVIVDGGVAGSHTWTKPSDAYTLFIDIRENSIDFQETME